VDLPDNELVIECGSCGCDIYFDESPDGLCAACSEELAKGGE
jgi:hypothetical protein